ncbi:hypothetical protein AMTR_s00052p00181810 [Amborella trichopoda]|uniref:Uncharacterized protein n=1 Tax=Amborella trichopoda TaxID=13333 RepID=U5D4U4_AMBTC|nr:hypothetical protein AMTR_s00052p00181810 [Amborella trichopoda]
MNCSVFQSDIRTLKKPADGAKDVSYSLAEMFGIPDEYDAMAFKKHAMDKGSSQILLR